jgi:hypothetical protein
MTGFLPVAHGNAALIAALSDPAIRIVSLTVTEGGYYLDPATGAFDPGHPDIRADAAAPDRPGTAFGAILAALKARRAAGHPAFTVMSCDNLPGNGDVTRAAVAGLARVTDPGLADAGLHAELWTDTQALPAIAERLRTLPVPLVIDHMGGFDVTAGIDHPGFDCLRRLVADGQAWVKLCAYRSLLTADDFELGRPFHDTLLSANPQQLVWGSDWPHLREQPVPDATQLLDTLRRWTPADDQLSQILVANPETLYR